MGKLRGKLIEGSRPESTAQPGDKGSSTLGRDFVDQTRHPVNAAHRDYTDGVTTARKRIQTLTRIAVESGSSLSVEELFSLLPAEAFPTPEALRDFLLADTVLGSELAVLDGEIVPNGLDHLATARTWQRDRTSRRVEKARDVVHLLTRICPWTRLIGISGSTAYNGSKPTDDVDFFVVVDSRRVWITLCIALLIARLFKIRDRHGPVFCFNCVWEDSRCESAFRSSIEPLFAREALSLKILSGEGYYRELLKSAPWMADYFPRLYGSRLDYVTPVRSPGGSVGRRGWSMMNIAAFTALVPYLWLVNLARNRKLEKEGRNSALFETIVRPGFFALESKRFSDLRQQYSGMF